MAELLATCPEEARLSPGAAGSGAVSGGGGVGVEDLGLCVETNARGWITRRGFMAHWA